MREQKSLTLSKYSQFSAIILSCGVALSSGGTAQALTADDVLNRMNTDQQYSYLAGMIGGFAHSRFLRDKPDQSGMNCIFDWYYGSGTKKWPIIEQWFSRHLDKQVEPLLYVLIKRECGE